MILIHLKYFIWVFSSTPALMYAIITEVGHNRRIIAEDQILMEKYAIETYGTNFLFIPKTLLH